MSYPYALPILTDISPIDQVALLQTDMNSGFRLAASIGINSPEMDVMNILKDA